MTTKSTDRPSLSELTIRQILNIMRPNGPVLAVGKYQAIPGTFKEWIAAQNILPDLVFDASVQEKLGDWLIIGKRPRVAEYVLGDNFMSVRDVQLELAKEFASVPVPYAVTRPKITIGEEIYPETQLQRGQSYYFGIRNNNATARPEIYENALNEAKRQRKLAPLKEVIASGEGNYDSINRGTAGDTPLYSREYYDALEGKPSTGNLPQINPDVYFTETFIAPLSSSYGALVNAINTKQLIVESSVTLQDFIRNSLTRRDQLEGELKLLRGVAVSAVEVSNQTKALSARLKNNILPTEAIYLVTYDLFEFYPDLMRQKMSANAGAGENLNYSHAWRAPGKLAITANITIPGASGFRIGQIFRIGRTYEHYKDFGAFQLFGLTETIELNRGWTTELYARFNAIPKDKLIGLKSV
jgi:hypothetical protein